MRSIKWVHLKWVHKALCGWDSRIRVSTSSFDLTGVNILGKKSAGSKASTFDIGLAIKMGIFGLHFMGKRCWFWLVCRVFPLVLLPSPVLNLIKSILSLSLVFTNIYKVTVILYTYSVRLSPLFSIHYYGQQNAGVKCRIQNEDQKQREQSGSSATWPTHAQ